MDINPHQAFHLFIRYPNPFTVIKNGGIPSAICRFLNGGHMPDGDVHLMGQRIVRQIIMAHEGTISVKEDGREIEVRFQPAMKEQDR